MSVESRGVGIHEYVIQKLPFSDLARQSRLHPTPEPPRGQPSRLSSGLPIAQTGDIVEQDVYRLDYLRNELAIGTVI